MTWGKIFCPICHSRLFAASGGAGAWTPSTRCPSLERAPVVPIKSILTSQVIDINYPTVASRWPHFALKPRTNSWMSSVHFKWIDDYRWRIFGHSESCCFETPWAHLRLKNYYLCIHQKKVVWHLYRCLDSKKRSSVKSIKLGS